ncbi:MAG: hypothetical protein ABR971_01290 [Acidobacteriaceae bacterium]|jgi:hypothetical protein
MNRLSEQGLRGLGLRVHFSAQGLKCWSLIALVVCASTPRAQADAMPVRYVQGSFHGFLELRSEGGNVVASGDSLQSVRGDRITAETIFHFKDGSVDDETTVYTQHRTFHLISDRHVQKGPSFPHPMDVLIDTASGMVTVRTADKDGKATESSQHMTLPEDLANGLIPVVVENMQAAQQGTTVEMVVMAPKPRVVKLVITNLGEESCSVVDVATKATHYEIKIVLGGAIGLIAPLVGKAPPNIQIWVIRGVAPTFAREQGPMYAEGPVMNIRLASPVWPGAGKIGN